MGSQFLVAYWTILIFECAVLEGGSAVHDDATRQGYGPIHDLAGYRVQELLSIFACLISLERFEDAYEHLLVVIGSDI